MKNITKIFNTWIKNNVVRYSILNLFAILSETAFVFLMWIIGQYFNAIPVKKSFSISNIIFTQNEFYFIVATLLILYIISIFIYKHMNFKLSNLSMIYLESAVLKEVLDIDYECISKRNKIEIAQQINNDCVIISDFIIEKIPLLFIKIFKIILVLSLIGIVSLKISVIVLLSALLFLFMYNSQKNKYKRFNIDMNEKRMKYFGVLGSELLNIFLVKANVWNDRTLDKFKRTGSEFVSSSVKFLDLDNLINNSFFIISTVMTLIIPLIFINSTYINYSGLLVIIVLINQYYPTCKEAFEIVTQLSIFENAKNRINKLIGLSREQCGTKNITNRIYEIKVNNLNFRYKDEEKYLLKNICVNFEQGNLYIIKGANGSGKSTFIKILLGILTDSSNSVLINNIPYSQLDYKDIRLNHISYCEQEPYIINGTLKENILYNSPKISTRTYENFINNFDLKKFSEDNSILTNTSLSGGEKQKIAIVRCLLKNSDIYIFDEPTSSLDIQSSKILKKEIQSLVENNKIVIIISHDALFDDIAALVTNMQPV